MGEKNIFDQFGSMLVLFLILAIITFLFLIASVILKKLGYSQKILKMIKGKLFWNTFLRTSLQSYIKTSFTVFTNLRLLKWAKFFDVVKSLGVLTAVPILLTLPPFYAAVLYRNQINLGHDQMKAQIGSIYLEIRTRNFLQLYYTVVFLLRRLLFIPLLIEFKDQSNILSCMFLAMNTTYLIYLYEALPHCSPKGRLMEVLNETLLQLITYHVYAVTFRNRFKSNAGDFTEAMETVSEL